MSHFKKAVCKGCGKLFESKFPCWTKRRKYCSLECYHKHRTTKTKTQCLNCGKEFFYYKSNPHHQGKYCSRRCYESSEEALRNKKSAGRKTWEGISKQDRVEMGKRRWKKGMAFEKRIEGILKEHGWKTFRCEQSKPLDIIAAKKGELRFIECKSNYQEYGPELRRLAQISKEIGFPIFLIFNGKGLSVREVTEYYWAARELERVLQDAETPRVRLAYLSYPYTDNPEKRTEEVLTLAQEIIAKNPDLVLIIPHIAVDTEEIREAIIENYGHVGFAKWDLSIIKRCEVFIIGCPLDYRLSSGMVWETAYAELEGKEILKAEDLI